MIGDQDLAEQVILFLEEEEEEERRIARRKQMEGIESAREAGVKFGRPEIRPTEEFYQVVAAWQQKKLTGSQAAEILGISRRTYQNMVKKFILTL